ncbi:MAG TPA: YbjN domain-containing protein [Thermoleophilaceae bacterium]|nr:YbjN domain-containing protein [Thermoleophilaceae bacterium]
MAAVDVVDAYVDALPGGARRLAHAEWGITVPPEAAGGEALDVGLRIADGLLSTKAAALGPAPDLDPWMLLWWNRQTRHVRFGCTRSREIWVHADLPVTAVDERSLDRLLGLVAEGAIAVRDYASRARGGAC